MYNTECRLREILYIFSIRQWRNTWQKSKRHETFWLYMTNLLCFTCSRVCIWLYHRLILPVTVCIMKRTEEFPSSRWALFAFGLLHSKLKHCCWYHTSFDYTNIQFPTMQVLHRKWSLSPSAAVLDQSLSAHCSKMKEKPQLLSALLERCYQTWKVEARANWCHFYI